MTRNLISALLIIFTIVAAVILYIVVFTQFGKIWFNFTAIFYLCLITFGAAVGIFFGAILVEKKS